MRRILAILGVIWFAAAPAAQAENHPVLIELYTSQGCSACPPADRLLGKLADRDDVIALALHVDYWDYIGWKDVFGDPAHAARQRAYAAKAGRRSVYTPQMILDGTDHVVGNRPMDVSDLIRKHRGQSSPVTLRVARQGGKLNITAQSSGPVGKTSIYLVRYVPQSTVAIERGENAGRTLTYHDVVTAWDRVDGWSGDGRYARSVSVAGDAPLVVVVQSGRYGPVLAAARLR